MSETNTASGDDSAARVTVSWVRLIIDGREFGWSVAGIGKMHDEPADSSFPEKESLLPETVISFLGFLPGQELIPGELASRCREAELGLQKSGYTYEASVLVLPNQKDANDCTVLVSVTTGFLWRFGGGNAFGVFGKEGLGGKRASVRVYAGWNKNGVRYMNYGFGLLPLVIGGRFDFYGPGQYAGKQSVTGTDFFAANHPLEAGVTAGWLCTPDLLCGIDTVHSGILSGSTGLVSLQPFLSWHRFLLAPAKNDDRDRPGDAMNVDFTMGDDIGGEVRGFLYPAIVTEKAEATGYTHLGIARRTVCAVRLSVGLSSSNLPPAAGFDLFYTDDRNVRSGYAPEELNASRFVFGSGEFRQTLAAFTVPPAIDCTVQAFAFSDMAVLREIGGMSRDRFADAYGIGMRILFDNPVFAWFTISYGMNHDGNGRFLFCGTAGY